MRTLRLRSTAPYSAVCDWRGHNGRRRRAIRTSRAAFPVDSARIAAWRCTVCSLLDGTRQQARRSEPGRRPCRRCCKWGVQAHTTATCRCVCGAGGGRRAVASGAGATCLATHASARTVIVARAAERIRALTIGSSGTHSGADTAVISVEIAIKVNITIACITAIPVPATVPCVIQVNRKRILPMESRQGANVALPSTRQQTQQQARYATHGTRNERQRSAELQRGAHSQGTHHLSVRGLQAQQQCTNSEDAQVEHRKVEGADEEGR